jgi:hypothetical protein
VLVGDVLVTANNDDIRAAVRDNRDARLLDL